MPGYSLAHRVNRSRSGAVIIPEWIAAFGTSRGGYRTVSLERVETRRQRLERENGPGWTADEWGKLKAKYGNTCLACGSSERLVPDHVIPLEGGGHHHISNIQPLCHRCNFKKGRRGTKDYRGD